MKAKKLKNTVKRLSAGILLIALACLCFGCSADPDNTPPSEGDTVDTPLPNPDETDSTPVIYPSEPTAPPHYYASVPWAENYTLPDADSAMEKLNTIYGGAEKVFLLQNGKIARMPCPQGETITLNMTYKVGKYTKLILENSIDEFNKVFSIINPNYRFAINYAPQETDFSEKYSVRMSVSDSLAVTETSQVFGLAHVSYYADFTQLGDFGITIKREVFNNGSYLMTTFKHELMHLLGAGDAYKNIFATKDTVMQNYAVNGYHHLSATDVTFLDALYRNPELNQFEQRILEYIDIHENSTLYTRPTLTAAVYQKLVDSLDPATVLDQAIAIGYEDLSLFSETIKDGIDRDKSFGKTSISFREIEYAGPAHTIYYGSIEPQTGIYWHGGQGASLGNSQDISYRDYGSGVLYAAPNGNLYTIMIQTGYYVLTFRLSGSFTDLPALALDLWHISKCG